MNWYKLAAWYDKPEPISPEEVGYEQDWGEHHGPVSMVKDTWNYGPKGYNDRAAPMPLPKKLYHVTPFADKIMQDGFKTFKDPKQQVFGGHGSYVSFTSLKNAKIYQEALKDFIKLANLDTTNEQKVNDFLRNYFMPKWGIKSSWIENLRRRATESQNDKDKPLNKPLALRNGILEAVGIAHVYSDKGFPIFIDSLTTGVKFVGMNPDVVRIIEAEVEPLEWHSGTNIFDKDMSRNYTYNGGENEWRIWEPSKAKPRQILASKAISLGSELRDAINQLIPHVINSVNKARDFARIRPKEAEEITDQIAYMKFENPYKQGETIPVGVYVLYLPGDFPPAWISHDKQDGKMVIVNAGQSFSVDEEHIAAILTHEIIHAIDPKTSPEQLERHHPTLDSRHNKYQYFVSPHEFDAYSSEMIETMNRIFEKNKADKQSLSIWLSNLERILRQGNILEIPQYLNLVLPMFVESVNKKPTLKRSLIQRLMNAIQQLRTQL